MADGKIEGKITVGLVQMGMSRSKMGNLQKAVGMVREAAEKGAQIVCLPELFSTEYFAQRQKERKEAESHAETVIGGKTALALSQAARENKIVLVGGSIYEKDDSHFYNTALVFGPDGALAGKYRKIHVPHDDCFFEKDYFEQGNLGFQVIDSGIAKIAPLICYDQWFPEAARAVSLMGADIITYPTAIGTVKGIEQAEGNWHSAWENVMRGHAIANGVAVAAVNRCGNEGKMEFWGGSFVCDAFGKTIAKAGGGEEIVIAQIDAEHGREVREGWGFFKNRQPGQYGRLMKK